MDLYGRRHVTPVTGLFSWIKWPRLAFLVQSSTGGNTNGRRRGEGIYYASRRRKKGTGIGKRDEDRSPTGCHWQFHDAIRARYTQVCPHCSRNWGNGAGSLNHHELDSIYISRHLYFRLPPVKGLSTFLGHLSLHRRIYRRNWPRSDSPSHRAEIVPFVAYEWITNHETWCFSFFSFVERNVFERNESAWNDSEKKQTGKNGRCNFFVFFFFFSSSKKQRRSNR